MAYIAPSSSEESGPCLISNRINNRLGLLGYIYISSHFRFTYLPTKWNLKPGPSTRVTATGYSVPKTSRPNATKHYCCL